MGWFFKEIKMKDKNWAVRRGKIESIPIPSSLGRGGGVAGATSEVS